MKTVTNPKVKVLSEGESFVTKEMAAGSGEFLPKHLASVESILIMREGACVLHLEDKDIILRQGDVFIIPADVVHQIEATQDFKAFHVMPKDIKFKFLT